MTNTAKIAILAGMAIVAIAIGYWVFSTPSPGGNVVSTNTLLPAPAPQPTGSNPSQPAATGNISINNEPVSQTNRITDCGTVNATELRAGALSQNAEHFLACVNQSLETCHPSTENMNVGTEHFFVSIAQPNGNCTIELSMPWQDGHFQLSCPFSNETLQTFFSAVEKNAPASTTIADRNALKGLTFINAVLGFAAINMISPFATSTTNHLNFSFKLPYTNSNLHCSASLSSS